MSPDKAAEIVERQLGAKSRWDGICLGIGTFVFIIYITPIAGVLQASWRAIAKVPSAVQSAADTAGDVANYWFPDLKKSPKVGETIAGYQVTSIFGKRSAPCKGCSDEHRGVDLGTPSGTAVYAIGSKPGEIVDVKCWWDEKGGGQVAEFDFGSYKFKYLHLQKGKCAGGKQPVGSVIGRTGKTGVGTGEHLHFQQEKKQGDKWVAIPPYAGFIWMSLTGDIPATPNASRREVK